MKCLSFDTITTQLTCRPAVLFKPAPRRKEKERLYNRVRQQERSHLLHNKCKTHTRSSTVCSICDVKIHSASLTANVQSSVSKADRQQESQKRGDNCFQAEKPITMWVRTLPRASCMTTSAVVVTGMVVLCLSLLHLTVTREQTVIYDEPDGRAEVGLAHSQPTFIIILCKGLGRILKEDLVRQLRQTNVLLKSAVALTTITLRFLVVTDTETLYDQVVSLTEGWPAQYRQRLVLEHHSVWYPPDREELRPLARPCSSARVFLTHIFPNLDAAVLLDTDTIFLRPPGQLWQHLRQFDDVQAVGMAPSGNRYRENLHKFPHYGDGGVNTGVMVMNFTRLKNLPGGGYTEAFLTAYDKYKDVLSEAYTNDVINIVFSQHPEMVYELPYEWNYTPMACRDGLNYSRQIRDRGVSILHATGASFLSGFSDKFQAVFEAWEEHHLQSPFTSMLATMTVYLRRRLGWDSCRFVPGIDDLLTKALRQRIDST
ncbi:glucoside xylosyltransferase 1-like [Panulirus ornatus]|uniref:glucoside xylosyltransferase 1-like n=1 Tax=Panulirus ornatus TaxID=150431 RepID=UPI003A89DDBC